MRFISGTFTGFFFGLIATALGLLIMILIGSKTTFICTRTEPGAGHCELVSAGLLGSEVQRIALGDLRGAAVQQSSSTRDRSSSDTYRVVLHMAGGDIPLTGAYTSGRDGKQRMADSINEYLAGGSEPTLTVTQDDRWIGYLFGGLFAVIGSLILLGSLFRLLRLVVGGAALLRGSR